MSVDVVTLGETMALFTSPQVGLLRHARSLDLGVAGAESNLAVGVTRLGGQAAWIGRVGDDEFGRLVQADEPDPAATTHPCRHSHHSGSHRRPRPSLLQQWAALPHHVDRPAAVSASSAEPLTPVQPEGNSEEPR